LRANLAVAVLHRESAARREIRECWEGREFVWGKWVVLGAPMECQQKSQNIAGMQKIDGEMIDHVWTERRQFRRRKRKNREAKKRVNEDEKY
jgi:hypothetical protein